jgi:hypothetical protein
MARRVILIPLAVLAAAQAAAAAEPAAPSEKPGPQFSTEFEIERAFTTNALDRVEALPDWKNTLRGGVVAVVPFETGRMRATVAAEQSAQQRYSIEDDSALRLALASEHAASDRLSLGAETSFGVTTEGDDIDVDDVVLGIRTRTLSAGAGLKAAYRLSDRLALSGEISVATARPDAAIFEAGLVEPTQLSARRDTVGAGLRLAHTSGTTTYAGAAGAELIRVGTPGEPPYDYRAGRQFARAEAARAWGKFGLKAAAGAERLGVEGGGFAVVRPSLALEAKYAFAGGASLRGALSAGMDLTGGDDPLGSWLRAVEIEAGLPVGERLTLSAGGSYFWRENFVLGYSEAGWGAWAGARVALTGGLALKAEFGASSRRPDVPGAAPIASLDASVALALALPKEEPGSAR